MGIRWRDQDLTFVQPERAGMVEDLTRVEDVRAYKRDQGFPFWGGEKTWLAPQRAWTEDVPFLDLDSGAYQTTVSGFDGGSGIVVMVSPICRETGVQITRIVSVAGNGAWSVIHRLTNRLPQPVSWGLWGVTMLRRPTKVYLPRNERSVYPEGLKTFVEEGASVTLRPQVTRHMGAFIEVQCLASGKFKFGVDARIEPQDGLGWILGVMETGLGCVGYRKSIPVFSAATYGHGCFAEVFNSDQYAYCELELHAPVVMLAPGASYELTEQHRLFDLDTWPQDETQVRAFLAS